MNKVQSILIVVLTLLLLVVYGLFQYWKNRAIKAEGLPPQIVEVQLGSSDTIFVNVPVTQTVVQTVIDTFYINEPIDTPRVLYDYLRVERKYSGVVVDDSLLFLRYNASVKQNRLNELSFDMFRKPYTVTTMVQNNTPAPQYDFVNVYGKMGMYAGYFAPGGVVTLPNGLFFEYSYLAGAPQPHCGAVGVRLLKIRSTK